MGSVQVLVLGCVLEHGEMAPHEYEGGSVLTEGQRAALKALEPVKVVKARLAFKHPVTGDLRYTAEETFSLGGCEFIMVWSIREMLHLGEIAPDLERCAGLVDLLNALGAEGAE